MVKEIVLLGVVVVEILEEEMETGAEDAEDAEDAAVVVEQ